MEGKLSISAPPNPTQTYQQQQRTTDREAQAEEGARPASAGPRAGGGGCLGVAYYISLCVNGVCPTHASPGILCARPITNTSTPQTEPTDRRPPPRREAGLASAAWAAAAATAATERAAGVEGGGEGGAGRGWGWGAAPTGGVSYGFGFLLSDISAAGPCPPLDSPTRQPSTYTTRKRKRRSLLVLGPPSAVAYHRLEEAERRLLRLTKYAPFCARRLGGPHTLTTRSCAHVPAVCVVWSPRA